MGWPGRHVTSCRRLAAIVVMAALAGACVGPNPRFDRRPAAVDSGTAADGSGRVDEPARADAPLDPPGGVHEAAQAPDAGQDIHPDVRPADIVSTADQMPVPDAVLAPDAALEAAGTMDAAADQPPDQPPDLPPFPAATVALPVARTTPLRGGSGGSQYDDLCPPGEALIGYRGLSGPNLADYMIVIELVGLCGKLLLPATDPGGVRIGTGGMLPRRGNVTRTADPRDRTFTTICPADQVVSGYGGSEGSSLDSLYLRCAPLTAASAAMPAFTRGTLRPLAPVGGSGGNDFAEDCAAGQVVRGHRVRQGDWIDALAIACATPTLMP